MVSSIPDGSLLPNELTTYRESYVDVPNPQFFGPKSIEPYLRMLRCSNILRTEGLHKDAAGRPATIRYWFIEEVQSDLAG
jgi:hypothetical protein